MDIEEKLGERLVLEVGVFCKKNRQNVHLHPPREGENTRRLTAGWRPKNRLWPVWSFETELF
jgi:hypothetical protein